MILLLIVLFSLSPLDYSYAESHPSIYNIGCLPREGLFSCFFGVLNALLVCEKENKIPVVYWHKNSLYYQEEGFNGSANVWEYYFEPLSEYGYDPQIRINMLGGTFFYFTKQDQPTRDKAHKLISSYIKLKPSVQQKIDDFYEHHMVGKRTIGIHLRGTDRGTYKKNEDNSFPLLKTIAQTALQHADEETQFLIASDDQELLDSMVQLLDHYPVIYYPCFRSLNGKGLHNGIHTDNQAPSRAQLGEDVLVEGLLLAKCGILLHTSSSVSTAVLYFNPNITSVNFSDRLREPFNRNKKWRERPLKRVQI